MKRKVAKLRPSPNEEARLIREEHERRRKLRIQQVREQQRYISLQICREVQQRRQLELEQLAEQLRQDWEQQQREKLNTLQRLYQESLQLLGQGHRSAKENEPDLAALAQRKEENYTKAEERYREALKELKSQRLKDHEMHMRSINARKMALQTEKERAAKVASLPPPPPNPIQYIDSKKPHVVKKSDVSAFAATHYHMPVSTVDREVDTQQPSAHEEAELEVRRLQDLQREEKRRREEQLEKARLRGKQALRREQLVQDRERLLVELEHMQQTDLLRRRQQVSQMPPQIFQPLYKRQEMREDFQREMEFAFEDMYTGERRVKGDLVVQLMPEPLPAQSAGSQDQELDVTLDEVATPETEETQHDTEQESGSSEQEASAEVKPSKPAARRALKKLLDRIRSQRSQWTDHNSHVPAADSPAATSDLIPERDTTIDTGSLTSEERDRPPPTRLLQPARSPPALGMTEHPSADPLLPGVLPNRIQEFEEEQKKREKELEKEKQQQMVLLQELDEQKAKLEQMLLEAQQEREHLKTAVTQEVPVNQLGVPVRDLEVTSVTPGPATELVPPAAEDDHSRRIREYQLRLLEQNRVHKRSVEVARQRLEEYQRALRIRFNTKSTSLLPAVVAPGLSQPPLHKTHLRVGSELLPDEVESISNGNQRRDVTAWLTDNIMERVTGHLPERVRPSSVTTAPLPYRPSTTHQSSSVSLQSASEPVRAMSPNITSGAHMAPEHAGAKPRTLLHGDLQTGSLSSREDDMEEQRRELQEVQRRVLEQREEVTLRQRQQEEQRQRREVEMQQMRQQKETLQALILTDTQPVPEAAGEAMGSESISRLKLLASLLRAIEESNGGTLSHLEDPQEADGARQQPPSSSGEKDTVTQSRVSAGPFSASVLPSGLLSPPQTANPPLTRIRPGIMGMMCEQHELSAIQEVETPIDTSQVTGLEDSVAVPSHTVDRDPQEESGSGTSNHLIWRERLLMGAGTSPESSEPDSPLSSDSGRGADYSGGAVTSHRSWTESLRRLADSDSFSSTTISTGSYITTDPDQNPDKSPPTIHREEQRRETVLPDFTPSSQGSCTEDCSAAACLAGALFNDSSIQHIIDRYRRELSICLSTSGRTTDTEGSCVLKPGSPVSQQSLVQASERRPGCDSSVGHRSPPSDAARTQRSLLEQNNMVDPTLERVTGEDSEQNSFRPLIGQMADESSCLIGDQGDSAMEQLVGHPYAHSSVIGQLPGWDSTLSRMIGRLSHQSSSHWLSGGQEFYTGQLLGQTALERSSTWMEGGQEDDQMRPLVGELDDHSANSGEGTCVGVSAEALVPSGPVLPPAASSHRAFVPGVNPQPQELQNQSRPMDLGSERTEVFHSFHPLLAEVTHNDTAEPSMTFHLPEHEVPNSPEGQPASGPFNVSVPSEGSEFHTDGSESPPEHLRSEQQSGHLTTLHESFSHLITSQCHPLDSAILVSPITRTDMDQTVLCPLDLTMCDAAPALCVPQPEGRGADRDCISERPGDPAPFSDLNAEEHKSEQGSNLNSDGHVSDKITEVASEKGILEQSEITLVSLTDTTLQDQDTAIAEEDGMWGDEHPDVVREEGQISCQTEGSQFTSLPEKMAEEKNQMDPVWFLEVQWGPSQELQEVCQQKRTALLQRSSRRVEEIKAKAALAKVQPDIQAGSEAREQSKAGESQPLTCEAKTKLGPQHKTKDKSKEAPAEQQQPVSDSRQKKVDEMKIYTTEQRKREVSKMHQRTRRLYEQLEEVKQQKAIKSRHEAYANNRLKAREFHKKTLQKLRAQQSRR
uniref:Uncharacterized protein n=1 Tax=Monopterus albus TaxID=43700 RepID=A0A3Q3JPE7_MONAL|nr:centrosomal protein of 295 kDa isoform X2 [Monopterus albus]